MKPEILTVGTELLLGDILNSNSQFLSREMAAYGIDVLYQSTVGDNAERLKNALTLALSRCDMVILTGGLGPTEDDITRETVAAHFNLPLALHEESDRRIREYFHNTGREYTENNQKQAMLPEGCVVFRNDHGTAPGFAVEKYGQTVILLPGPPRELVPMFIEQVAPYLSKWAGGTIYSHTVGVFGVPEAVVDERLQDLMKSENPTLAPYAKDGEVVLRITAKAENRQLADQLCEPMIAQIRERLGTAVYGVDVSSLQTVVVALLKEKDLKIATAESCTAGLLSERLTQVPGVSDVFECGIAAYSKEIKHQVLGVPAQVLEEKGAVSPETAATMAMGARSVGSADIGIGITGVAGPDPSEEKAVGTVYVALADDRRVWVKKIFAGHGGDREYIRYVATSHALDMARRYLEAYPGVMAGGQTVDKMYDRHKGKLWSPRAKKTVWFSALAILLVAALVLTYVYVLTPHLNQKKFEELWDAYSGQIIDPTPVVDDDVTYPEGMLSRFESLYRVNSDLRGWLTIENSEIRYPVVQEPEDGFYDNRDFYKNSSLYGVPYVDKDVTLTVAEEPRSLVIYGNNPRNRQMFAQLTSYTQLSYLREHSVIEWNTLYRSDRYKVFAVMIVGEAERYSDNFDYTVDIFDNEDDFLYYVSQLRQRSLFDTPVSVQEGDSLLMLTTPIDYGFDGARLVVVARRARLGEIEENNLARARVNENVLMPLAWQLQQGDITVATTMSTDTTTVATDTTTVATSTTLSTTETAATETTTTQATTTTVGTTTVTTTTTTVTTTVTTTEATTSTATTVDSTTGETVTTTVTDTEETTEATTTATTTGKPPVVKPSEEGLVAGTVKEAEFLSLFAIRASGQVIRPENKEELQMVLAGVVKAEMGAASTMVGSTEAQKAQAVASYSFILYHAKNGNPVEVAYKAIDLNNTHDKKIYDAVGAVLGVKLGDVTASAAKNIPLCAFYHASSSGLTASSQMVWSGALPYAQSVSSKHDNDITIGKYYDSGARNFEKIVTLDREKLYDKVKAWVAKNVPAATMPEEQFTVKQGQLPLYAISYDGDGTEGQGDNWNYVYRTNFYYVTENGTKVHLKGATMRDVLGLNSHAFRVEYDEKSGRVTVTSHGHGHGVGLSQMGAVGYANEDGWDYVRILKHYYSVTDTSAHQLIAPVW